MEHGVEVLQLVKVIVTLASVVVAFTLFLQALVQAIIFMLYLYCIDCKTITEAQQLLSSHSHIYQHHNAPPSSLLSMEECLLAEVQLPTPVPLATV